MMGRDAWSRGSLVAKSRAKAKATTKPRKKPTTEAAGATEQAGPDADRMRKLARKLRGQKARISNLKSMGFKAWRKPFHPIVSGLPVNTAWVFWTLERGYRKHPCIGLTAREVGRAAFYLMTQEEDRIELAALERASGWRLQRVQIDNARRGLVVGNWLKWVEPSDVASRRLAGQVLTDRKGKPGT